MVAVGGLMYLFRGGSSTEISPLTMLTDTDWVRGATNAKVTLIEYGDFQCPACATYEGVVQQIQTDFKNDLTFIYRHFPLAQINQNALMASKASEAAGLQQKFWEMHDMIFENQSEWSSSANAKEIFISYAKKIGVDISKFKNDIDNSTIAKKIEDDYRGGIALKVAGTPTFFLNGKKMDNPGSYDAFRVQVEVVLKEIQ